jgi:Flp pilus assembly pilin Flp
MGLYTDESGATAIEYTMVAAMFAIAALLAFQLLANRLGASYDESADQITTATAP